MEIPSFARSPTALVFFIYRKFGTAVVKITNLLPAQNQPNPQSETCCRTSYSHRLVAHRLVAHHLEEKWVVVAEQGTWGNPFLGSPAVAEWRRWHAIETTSSSCRYFQWYGRVNPFAGSYQRSIDQREHTIPQPHSRKEVIGPDDRFLLDTRPVDTTLRIFADHESGRRFPTGGRCTNLRVQ